MKKLVFLTMVFIIAMSSIGMCAVPDSTGIGDLQFGYNYYGLKQSSGSVGQGTKGMNEFYGSVGLGLGYGAFINYGTASNTSYTDYGIKTSVLVPNINLMVGQRRMETDNAASDNNLFVGATIKQDLIDGVAAYATYQKGSDFRDEVIGLTYAVSQNVQMDLSWKNYDNNNGMNFKGIGGGVNFKF